jgi:hypothetical protein
MSKVLSALVNNMGHWGIEASIFPLCFLFSLALSEPKEKKDSSTGCNHPLFSVPFSFYFSSLYFLSRVNRCFPRLLSLLNRTPITSRLGSSSQGPNQRLDFDCSLYYATTVYVRGVSIYICICIRGLVSDPSLLTRIDFFTHTLSPTPQQLNPYPYSRNSTTLQLA